MFGLFSRMRSTKTIDRRPRLWVEQLEARDCPALSIDFLPVSVLSATVLPGHEVLLAGDLHSADATVTFSGAVSATTTTDAAGNFSLVTSDATLGAVYAAAGGDEASANIAVAAPALSLSLVYDSASTVTLSGTMTDIDAAGATVTFTGLVAGSTVTDANGNFSYTTSVSAIGAIDAATTDLWGQASNTAEVDVTAAPTVTLATQVFAGHQVQLTGTVSGAFAAGATVTFSGAVNGSTTAGANGNYTFTTTSATLGTVTAVAVDGQQHTSNAASATVAEAAPTITLTVTAASADSVTLSGTVTDIDAAGESVAISGALNETVTADANGNFSFTMPTADLGSVNVATTDQWGQAGGVAANSFPPVIETFSATQSDGNTWIFAGTVVAPNVQGLTISFGGLASLAGQTATVAANGTFTLVQALGLDEYGTATAQTTDLNGQNSNLASAIVG